VNVIRGWPIYLSAAFNGKAGLPACDKEVLQMNFEAFFSPWRPYALSILRIVTALLLLEHATMKLFGFPPSQFSPPLFSLFGIAGMIELVGGLLLVAGLFTRPVALILSGEMAVAYFMAHAPNSFFPVINQGEAAILFCFTFLYVATAGAGPWSLDHWRATGNPSAASAPA
jgi:putative oxidoreductase